MKKYDMVKYGVQTYRLNQFYSEDYLLLNIKYMIENNEYLGIVTSVHPDGDVLVIRECPKCGNLYTGYPALSRRDNKTEICSDCGVREALEDFIKVGDNK